MLTKAYTFINLSVSKRKQLLIKGNNFIYKIFEKNKDLIFTNLGSSFSTRRVSGRAFPRDIIAKPNLKNPSESRR